MPSKIERPQVVKLLIAFVFATLAIILIFILSNAVSYVNYYNSIEQNNIILEGVVYLEEASDNLICSGEFVVDVSERLDEVAMRMGLLETRWGKNDPRVKEQKDFYSELQYRHFEIMTGLNERCDAGFIPIFFFYSNSPEAETASEKISFILQSFKSENSEKIMVYSFDYNLESPLVDYLEKDFGVDFAPVVVIGPNQSIFVPNNIRDLDKYLD